jgi:hypothetical protein
MPPAKKRSARYMGYFEMRRLFDRRRIIDFGLLWVKFTDIFYFEAGKPTSQPVMRLLKNAAHHRYHFSGKQ